MAVEPLGPNASPEEITVKLNELIGAFNEQIYRLSPGTNASTPSRHST